MDICFYTDKNISGMTGGIGRITSVMTDYFRHNFGWKVYSIYAFEANADCVRTEVDGAIRLRLHDRFNLNQSIKANYVKAVQFLAESHVEVMIVQTSLDVVAKLRKALDKAGHPELRILSVLHFAPGRDEWPWQKGGIKGLLAPIRNAYIHHATVRAYRSAYEKGEQVLLLSRNYIQEYQTYAGLKETSKLTALANCLSFTETISEEERQQKQPIALVVARMEEVQKRISLILKIWKKIEERMSANKREPWLLQIVGEGESLASYKRMAKELELEHVSFEGRQNPVPYYKKASIFLMTSSFEGFPMTLVEASQFGCVPIVYNSFSSLEDVVTDGQNGFMLKEGDETGFIDRLEQLMTNQNLLSKMSERALTDCQRFSQETICNEWKKIIER